MKDKVKHAFVSITIVMLIIIVIISSVGCSSGATGIKINTDDSLPVKTASFDELNSYDDSELYILNVTEDEISEYAVKSMKNWIYVFDLPGHETDYETFFMPMPNYDTYKFSIYAKDTKKYVRSGMLAKGAYSAIWKLAEASSEENPVILAGTDRGWYAILGDKAYSFTLYAGKGFYTSLPEPDVSGHSTEVICSKRLGKNSN